MDLYGTDINSPLPAAAVQSYKLVHTYLLELHAYYNRTVTGLQPDCAVCITDYLEILTCQYAVSMQLDQPHQNGIQPAILKLVGRSKLCLFTT